MQIMLLDLIHEDLNKVTVKPYIELPNYNSFDPSQSSAMWAYHLQRQNSQIVDWFYGQTVTEIECCECGEVPPSSPSPLASREIRAVQHAVASSSSGAHFPHGERASRLLHRHRIIITLSTNHLQSIGHRLGETPAISPR